MSQARTQFLVITLLTACAQAHHTSGPDASSPDASIRVRDAAIDSDACRSFCDDPPAQECIDLDTVRVYDAIGECTAGECRYASRDLTCPSCPSCDPCDGTVCDAPPASTCIDSNTLRTFASTGTCTRGACDYAPTDMPCLLGCEDDRCLAPDDFVSSYIKASNTGAGDAFGHSISLFGDLLAVGAPMEDSAATGVGGDQVNNRATDSGAVYIFRRSAGTWTQEAYLKASNADPRDEFGHSVSLYGDLLAVGARHEDSSATGVGGDETNDGVSDSGAVYVFRRSAEGTWIEEAYIKASNTGAEDYFGASVSLSGELLAVGAFGEDSAATGIGGEQANDALGNSGAVYVFRRSASGTWAEEAYLKASSTGASDYFGAAISLSGNLLAVGASGRDRWVDGEGEPTPRIIPDCGAVFVFRRSESGTWIEEAHLTASNFSWEDFFGASVSLSANLLAVGVIGEDSSATDSGAVFVFRRSESGTWTEEAYLKASNIGTDDWFGVSVSLSGELLAVGAYWEDSAAIGVDGDQSDDFARARESGAVYVFRRSAAGSWAQEAYVKASNTGVDDRFGHSVSLSGDLLAVGGPNEDSAATGVNGDQAENSTTNSGAVYVYR